MGFAAVTSHAHNTVDSASAVEGLQIKLITSDSIAASELHQALQQDLAEERPINQTILLKILSSSKITLNSFDFQRLAVLIRDAMIKLPMSGSDLFINYAQSAALCMKNVISSAS